MKNREYLDHMKERFREYTYNAENIIDSMTEYDRTNVVYKDDEVGEEQ